MVTIYRPTKINQVRVYKFCVFTRATCFVTLPEECTVVVVMDGFNVAKMTSD
jgi:hypothetical protein